MSDIKVSGPGGPRRVDNRKPTSKTSGGGQGGFAQTLNALNSVDAVEAAPPPEEMAPATPMAAILAAQEADPDAERRQQNRRLMDQGHALLDGLESIRAGLLQGHVPEERLLSLARQVRDRKATPQADPRVQELLDEIELRVEVELAKLRRGGVLA